MQMYMWLTSSRRVHWSAKIGSRLKPLQLRLWQLTPPEPKLRRPDLGAKLIVEVNVLERGVCDGNMTLNMGAEVHDGALVSPERHRSTWLSPFIRREGNR
jgi:hypothetical protein